MNKRIERITFDFIGLGVSFAPSLTALYLSILLTKDFSLFFKILLSIPIFTFLFMLFLFLIRVSIPRLKPGVFSIGLNRGFLAWFLHLSLSRSILIVPIKSYVYSNSITRFLFFRALGAKVSFNTSFAINSELSDLPLITVEENSIIADHVKINAHLLNNEKLFLSPVKIEEGCFIGEGSKISARVRIFKGVVIAPNSSLANTKVKE